MSATTVAYLELTSVRFAHLSVIAELRFTPDAPHEVQLRLVHENHRSAPWVFDRSLLVDGLRAPAGEETCGAVLVRPYTGDVHAPARIVITLRSSTLHEEFLVQSSAIAAITDRFDAACERSDPDAHVSACLDAALASILGERHV